MVFQLWELASLVGRSGRILMTDVLGYMIRFWV
jgi:hypothetical protein